MQHMRVLEVAAAVGLTALGSLGIVAMSWHRTAEAGVLPHQTPAPLTRARGLVQQLDLEHGQVTLDVADGAVALGVDSSTTVFIDGRPADLASLPIGVPICAAFESGQRELPVAHWLEPCAD